MARKSNRSRNVSIQLRDIFDKAAKRLGVEIIYMAEINWDNVDEAANILEEIVKVIQTDNIEYYEIKKYVGIHLKVKKLK